MNALLNGMNDRQAEAVQTTEGPLLIMAGAVLEDSCFDPPYRLFDWWKDGQSLEYLGHYLY